MIRSRLALGAAVIGVLVAAHRYRDWGATPGEARATLPGDELVPGPADCATLAVTIEASAAEVWRWLVQLGQDRGGMYSYDAVENLIGLDIHSTDEIRDEWQDLAVGDRIVLVREGWPLMPAGYALPVARIERGRAMVLRQAPPEHPWNAVWSFVIEPLGLGRCRLISRSRAARAGGIGLRAASAAMRPVTLVMTRRMLLGIAARAERAARAADTAASGPRSVLPEPHRPRHAGTFGTPARPPASGWLHPTEPPPD